MKNIWGYVQYRHWVADWVTDGSRSWNKCRVGTDGADGKIETVRNGSRC